MKNYITHLVTFRWISVTLTLSSEDEIPRGVFYIVCEYIRGGKPFGQWPLIFATIFNGTIQSHRTDWREFRKVVYLDEEYFSWSFCSREETFRVDDFAIHTSEIALAYVPAASATRFTSRIFFLRNGIWLLMGHRRACSAIRVFTIIHSIFLKV